MEHYSSQVLTLDLTATLIRNNVGRRPGCPGGTENKDTLCTHYMGLEPVQPASNLHQSTICAPES